MNDWQPPKTETEVYKISEEQAPWGRWIITALLIGLILWGAIWLASKVIMPEEVPNKLSPTISEQTEPIAEPVQKSSDDEAWVKALEKDTLEGYREYLSAFPKGKHKEEAQTQINAYDNKAWNSAEQRQTMAGYEDYLTAWPEGLHASKAKEIITEMKAAAEARAKDAAEKARLDKVHWEEAAQQNTIASYQAYMAKHPAGEFVSEAQSRIDRLQADIDKEKITQIEHAAWEQAKSANRVDSYQLYLNSYPQGVYAAQAMAAIEKLKPAAGRTFKDCDVCPRMVSLPSGTISLGADEDEAGARANEKPIRPVTLSNLFAMSVTEITFDQWQACVSGGGCKANPKDKGWGRGNRPAINVSWDEAQKYTAWLSAKTGSAYSLPSEAQWEYAARAGTTGSWIGGSLQALCAFANGASSESGLQWANNACNDMSADRTLPVGMLSANKFGLKDMIGNVAEWTLDCNTLNLRDAPADGRADMRGSCNQRVTRGGSWFSGPDDLRFAARLMQRRTDRNDFTGFRVVKKLKN